MFNAVLHGLKIQKYKKKRNNEDTDTKKNKIQEVKFASTNMGSVVIIMCIVPVQIKTNLAKRSTLTHSWIATARVHIGPTVK